MQDIFTRPRQFLLQAVRQNEAEQVVNQRRRVLRTEHNLVADPPTEVNCLIN